MRIGIDCRSLQDPNPSGVPLYTVQLLREMFSLEEASAHNFVLFFNAFGSLSKLGLQERLGIQSMQNIELRIRKLPNKVLSSFETIFARPSEKWMFGDVDVVFIPNMHFYPYKKSQVPYVLTIHDTTVERYPECLSWKGRMKWQYAIDMRAAVRGARNIIAVSENTKQDIQKIYAKPAEQIYSVYPGMNPVSKDPKPIQGLPEKFMLFLSTVEPRKNLKALLEAYATYSGEYALVVAGGAGWKSQKLIMQMRNMKNVHYVGYVTEQQKWWLLEEAHALLYPSLYEGFGFPPVEAQLVGTPVLTGLHSSLPEVLGNAALYVDVLDKDSLLRGLNALTSDNALCTRLIAEGKQNVERFSWLDTAKQTLLVLENSV